MSPYLKPHPEWEEHEKPFMPGSPSAPHHESPIRVAYGLVAILVGLTGGLGNALVSVNLPTLQGELGLTPSEVAWLPAAYAMVNVTANLLVFKFRQQYGMRLFAEIGLGLYAVLALLHLSIDSAGSLILLRGASGFSGAAASTLGVLYMLQAFPKRLLGKALVLGVSITQMATPLAWVLSPSLIELGNWHGLYSFEAGMALCAFAAVVLLKLPPGYQIKAFEKLDFLAFALFAPAAGLLIAFLTQGYIRWWFNDTGLAWMAMGSLFLFTLCVFIEYHRVNPLVKVRWLVQGSTIYFAVGAMILRFITTEQNYGMVNMLRSLGMGSEQMQPLFWLVFAGIVCGIVLSAVTFGPRTILVQVFAAILLIGLSSFMDFGRTSLDRPHDFFYSQFMLSIGAGMFMGPLVMIGFKQAFKFGPDHIVTFIVLLNVTQTLGGLMGTATLSTFEQQRQQHHYVAIVSHINAAEPLVANRLKQQQHAVGAVVTDPMLKAATGTAQLAQIARREANVRAYNDVFLLIGMLATFFLLWPILLAAGPIIQSRRVKSAVSGTSQNSSN